ncbi:hypothetical protein BDY19DRAFT_559649 [Irpex rosettiformis]|uniref:Uncharacterized protein n=1 Tax=Irpex rosettiformis TaxID=378272 RepID=A0ACB8TQ03_9APHY|nr:hypothetical protein BDY19DRAFT_559649 [Irpex rosettiformis]
MLVPPQSSYIHHTPHVPKPIYTRSFSFCFCLSFLVVPLIQHTYTHLLCELGSFLPVKFSYILPSYNSDGFFFSVWLAASSFGLVLCLER